MKALNTLRNLIFLLFFTAAAASASASDDTLKGKTVRKQAAHHAVKAQRKEVAPFVDPTLPLAELVERVRSERAR